jgi:hypothetical protein
MKSSQLHLLNNVFSSYKNFLKRGESIFLVHLVKDRKAYTAYRRESLDKTRYYSSCTMYMKDTVSLRI